MSNLTKRQKKLNKKQEKIDIKLDKLKEKEKALKQKKQVLATMAKEENEKIDNDNRIAKKKRRR